MSLIITLNTQTRYESHFGTILVKIMLMMFVFNSRRVSGLTHWSPRLCLFDLLLSECLLVYDIQFWKQYKYSLRRVNEYREIWGCKLFLLKREVQDEGVRGSQQSETSLRFEASQTRHAPPSGKHSPHPQIISDANCLWVHQWWVNKWGFCLSGEFTIWPYHRSDRETITGSPSVNDWLNLNVSTYTQSTIIDLNSPIPIDEPTSYKFRFVENSNRQFLELGTPSGDSLFKSLAWWRDTSHSHPRQLTHFLLCPLSASGRTTHTGYHIPLL